MKKMIFILAIFIIVNECFGQIENESYKKISNKFEYYYNSENYDSVFAMFSSDMQKHLPLDKTNEFLSNLKSQVGKISNRQFKKFENSYAIYKTNFERALLSLNISIDNESMINGLFIKPFVDENIPIIERNTTKLILPFKEEWFTVWGGDTKELNYHIDNQAQKNAFDFIIIDDYGKSCINEGKNNEDYYAFGKELIAPCDGEIVLVVDGIKDNIPGVMNPYYAPGNTVILKTEKNEYLFFGHFKQHSIKVKQGQKVKTGNILGLCGNSGNSSEAHLHFHIQNIEDMNSATGAKCYFDKIIVNGKLMEDYSPIQKDKIRNK